MVPGRRDLQHRRTEQGRSRHLPQEGGRAAVTASLKDTAGTASPRCCGHQAGARILAVETIMHGRTPGWHHPSGFACGKGKSLALGRQQDPNCRARPWQGAGTGCGCPVWAGVPGSLAQVGRDLSLVYLLLPPSQAPQPLITSCRSIPGPLCNSPRQHHRTGPATHCTHTRANRIWLAACQPPALCLQHPACSSAPPSGALEWGPPGRTLCPRGSPAPVLLPAQLESLGQPQPAGPGGDASQMAHDIASSGASWSSPGPGRDRMLHATGIPCCGRLAT